MAENHLDQQTTHDIREGLALAKGWLELVFRHWEEIDDPRKREMIAGALFGANRVAFILDLLDGRDPEELQSPQERMVEEFNRIGETIAPERFGMVRRQSSDGAGPNRAGTARFR